MATNETRPNGDPRPAQAQLITRKKKALRAYFILAVAASGALAAYFVHGYLTRNEVATDDAQIDADVVPISARVGGLVLHVKVHDHEPVRAGQVIAEIDPVDYQAKLAAASADLDAAVAQADAADAQVEIVKSTSAGGLSTAKAQLQGSSASVGAARAQVAAATAAVARAKSELAKAEADLARAKMLHDQGAMTQQAFEAAQTARDTASSGVDAANANLAAARDSQQLAETHIAEAQGRVQQSAPVDQQVAAAVASAKLARAKAGSAQAAYDLAKLQLSYATIAAPVDGFASKLGAHEGQIVQPGAMLLMIVPAKTYVVANFKETQIERIRKDDPVDISVDALSHGTLRGTVESLSPATGARFSMLPPDNATGNFVKVVQRVPVRIKWDDGQDLSQLHAGLSVEVTVHLRN
jgi:membrane fusion protein (multidrug efflux system)